MYSLFFYFKNIKINFKLSQDINLSFNFVFFHLTKMYFCYYFYLKIVIKYNLIFFKNPIKYKKIFLFTVPSNLTCI